MRKLLKKIYVSLAFASSICALASCDMSMSPSYDGNTSTTSAQPVTTTTKQQTSTTSTHTHSFSDWVIAKEGNCTESGIKRKTCSGCGEVLEISYTDTNNHSWDNGTVTKEENCTEKGIKTYTCTRCNETKTEEIPFNSDKHIYDNGIITTYPSFQNDGVKTYTCTKCGHTITEKLDKLVVTHNYTLDADLMDGLPGVYSVQAEKGATSTNDTIGIPTVAKQNLENYPTYEAPAIIRGAVPGYEVRGSGIEFNKIKDRIAPYDEFAYKIIKETLTNADGVSQTHLKLSGFDGSYYIIRVDVSKIIENKTGYLHVKQESNKALMVLLGVLGGVDTGIEVTLDSNNNPTNEPTIENGYWYINGVNTNISANGFTVDDAYQGDYVDTDLTVKKHWYVNGTGYSDALGNTANTYSLDDGAIILKDKTGNYTTTPYVDVIVMSSGKLVAGADQGKANAPSADIKLSFYVDDQFKYNNTKYDPNAQAPADTSQPTQDTLMLNKFFNAESMTQENNASSYLVKGSDLEIDVQIDEYQESGKPSEFWSLTKAMNYVQFDAHTIKLICEVPVLDFLEVEGTNEIKRHITLDVQSFDIQIANNTQTGKAGLTIGNNATLEILDSTRTAGAELAIGNNAKLLVKNGGKIIIDETCTLEVEYDAATVAQSSTTPSQTPEASIANGVITIESGGVIVNEGVFNIEGLEVKPNQQQTPGQTDVIVTDMKMAAIYINEGAIFENYGCISLKGEVYVMGVLNNYGKYNDVIERSDPDKGTIQYHKGIQLTWKDNVTNDQADANGKYSVRTDVVPGILYIGIDANTTNPTINKDATVNNYGDIVLVPGTINIYGTFKNLDSKKAGLNFEYCGHLYICDVTEAVVPITPTQQAPTVHEERRQFDKPYQSTVNYEQLKELYNEGTIQHATVKVLSNGILGELTPLLTNQ